jgi:hypothetical protein
MATVTVSSHPDVSVGSWEVQEEDGCVEATRTDQTKPRWVAACFGPVMEASEGPFHAEFVPTDLPRSSEIMFGVVSASADPAAATAKGLYATGSGWMYHANRGNHYHGDGNPDDVNSRGTHPIAWFGQRHLFRDCSQTIIMELIRGELRLYMRQLDRVLGRAQVAASTASWTGRIELLGTMCTGLSGPVRWATELLYVGNSVQVHLHNGPEGLSDCSENASWLASVVRDGMVLRWAPEPVRGDADIVLAAVAQNGMALRSATTELQGYSQIVHAAVAQDARALQFATAELQSQSMLRQLQALNPCVSAPLLAAELRLRLAYTCHERIGGESIPHCLPPEVIELIGEHCTISVAVLGLVCRPATLPPTHQALEAENAAQKLQIAEQGDEIAALKAQLAKFEGVPFEPEPEPEPESFEPEPELEPEP